MAKSKVVVITGASAGVGRATAIEFGKRGARVALIARGKRALEGAARDVEAVGGTALILQADVADAEQVEKAASEIDRTFGGLDVWVNNAMCSVFAPIQQTAAADIRRVTEVTYLGVVHGTQAALRRMTRRNEGTIVQVGSALAYRSIPLQAAYCASKHAIIGFTDSLRCELIHDQSSVRLTVVNLPAMNTPQFEWSKSQMMRRAQPVPPIFEPEVAARAIVHAVAHHRREWNVGLPTAEAVFANKFMPGALDYYLGRTGYDAQQTSELENPGKPNNLYEPVDIDPGTHGRFGDRAKDRSGQFLLSSNRFAILGGVVLLSALATGVFVKRR